MRIAQVLCAGSYAGAEAVATRLAHALEPRAEASVLYVVRELRAGRTSCDQLVTQVNRVGVRSRVFDVHSRWSPQLVRDLTAALECDQIDVLHAHAYKIAAQIPLLRRGKFPSATVFTVHGFDQASWHGRLFVGSMNAVGAYFADRLVCVSSQLASHYRAYPGLRRRVRVIANAAPPSDSHDWERVVAQRQAASESLQNALGLESNVLWVLAVGRLVPVKNLALLIDALELMGRKKRNPNFGLVVVGDGPLRADLEARTVRANLSVRFTGAVTDVTPYYRACAALVLSSDSEGSPMVVLEALAHGLPVVARAVGGVGDIVRDGREGLLVTERSMHAFAQALERILVDGALRAKLGRQAFERAQTDLAPEAWAERHLSLYQEMLRAS